MNKPGIALLIVIMCLSAFMLATYALYQAALLLPRFAQNEVTQQKNELLLDGALTYALAFCRENWQILAQQAYQGKKQEIFVVPLPADHASATIIIGLGAEQQDITVTLLRNNIKSATTQAIMHNDLSITHL